LRRFWQRPLLLRIKEASVVTWRSWFAFAALSVIWGFPYLFIKLAVSEISPVGVA